MSAHTATDVDRTPVLIRALGAAIATRRLYDRDHIQVRRCADTFLQELRAHLVRTESDRFRLLAAGGRLRFDGEAPGSEDAQATLARLLEEKGIGGLSFTADLIDYVFLALLDWFASRRSAGVPEGEWPGLEMLPAGSGDDHLEPGGEVDLALLPEFRVAREVHGEASRVLDSLMQDVRNRRPMDLREIADLVEHVAEAAATEGARLVAPSQLQRQDASPLQHGLHTFLTATTLLQPLAADVRHLARLCMAALLHDVGKALVPREILHRKGRLGTAEWALLRSHPERGAELLSKVRHLDTLACEVAYCHHMRDDGFGYPVAAMPIRPSPVAKIVQVADLFEALGAARPHSAPMTTADVAQTLLDLPGMRGRADALAHLLGRLTPSPPGCEVRLASGERAIVVDTHPDRPHHPTVTVHRDADGRDTGTPTTVNLREAAGDVERPVAEVFLKPALMRTGREAGKMERLLGEDWKPPGPDDPEDE